MIGETWLSVQKEAQDWCATLSIIINLFLIFLIITKSPHQFGAYKYLMIYIAMIEMVLSLMDAYVSPVYLSYGSSFAVLIGVEDAMFSRDVMLVMGAIFCAMYAASIGLFAITFFYRYLVVNGSNLLKTFDDWRVIFWFSIPLSYGSVWFIVAYFIACPNPRFNDYIKNNILELYDMKIENTLYLGLLFEDSSDFRPVIAVFIFWTIIVTSLCTITYFGVATYSKMNKLGQMASVSTRFKGLQSQLFYALVTQTMVPVILLHFPVFTWFLLAFLGKDVGMLSGIVTLSIAFFPVIDPLPNLFIIQSYRKAIYGYFKFIFSGLSRKPPRNSEITEMRTRF